MLGCYRPPLRKSSTANPGFLKEFSPKAHTRIISPLEGKPEMSNAAIAAQKGLTQRMFKKKPGARGYIMHVDFDSFFCAVSLKKHPKYAEKPTVVAHSSGPGS